MKKRLIGKQKTSKYLIKVFTSRNIWIKIVVISKEILSGNIALKPYNKNGKKPCEYCSYKAICGFNPRLCGNNYNYIDKKSKDDIIMKMAKN